MQVELTEQEWQQVLSLIGTKNLWVDCNAILMKIGQQLQQQRQEHHGGNSAAVSEPSNAGATGGTRTN